MATPTSSPAPTVDVVCVGNALVDILSNESFEFLSSRGLTSGSMNLIDEAAATDLYAATTPVAQASGGSAANTAAGIASFGGTAHFIGRVKDDDLGHVFSQDIQKIGVGFSNPAATEGSPTGRCVVLVTPDAERTLNTFLGASGEFEPSDVDPQVVASGGIVYLEGYLFDSDAAKRAFYQAADAAKGAGRRVALTLSDSFCVERYREAFLGFINSHVDLVFANEDEIQSLFDTNEFDHAVASSAEIAETVVITRSELGSVVVHGGESIAIPTTPVNDLVDTTGAGDQYAAGFMFGLTRGKPLDECARLGHLAASEVITHLGARPEVPLSSLL